MGVSWTDDQEKAIKAFGKGVTVSAAAGSGKTAVLIERVINLLCDKTRQIPADRLLAVTFTIDAAAQMRDKLATAFENRLKEDPDNKWLLQQQELVQLARISTIDSFCFDLVKENLNRFEFQGGLKIISDAERELIFRSAAEQALEELCRGELEEYELLDNFFGIENGGALKVVKALYDHKMSICHTDKWLENAFSYYESEETFKMLIEQNFEEFGRELERAKLMLKDARWCYNYLIKANGTEYYFKDAVGTSTYNMSACEDLVMSMELAFAHKDKKAVSGAVYPKYKKLMVSKKLPEDIRMKLDDVKSRFSDDIRAVASTIKEAARGFGLSDSHLKENMKLSNRIFAALCTLEERTEKIIYEMKLEKNAVDFSDVELMAKDLLVRETDGGFERTELAEEIRSGGLYQIIMIDEYQDVNDIQEMIFKAVSDTDDLSIMGKNTFIVGDMKQAIYGFRKTNPELFKNCIASACDEANKDKLEHIRLKMNFRSRAEVLGISNFLFETLMSNGCGEVDYNSEERLEHGANYTKRRCPAEIMLVDTREDTDSSLGFSQELYQTAVRIKELIDEKAPVCENGADRACRQSDFCILVNTNDNIKAAAKALEAVGLRAFSEDTAGYIKSREISLALDILRTVDNPMNDISLAAVMMSPVMGFSADEMTVVRQKCRSEKTGRYNHIYQVLSGAARAEGTDESYSKYVDMESELLQEKCRRTFGLIESLRYCSMSMSLERLVRRIFDVTDLMALTSMYLDSAKKRANLRLLLQYADEYERNGNEGVTGFLRFIDSVSGNDKAFKNAVSVSAGSDSVNVKTYHKSKGLEYPFVFLCTLSKKLIRDDSTDNIKIHKSLGYAFELKDKRLNVKRENLYYGYLSKILDSEQKSERMRLFYVGCTRAKERLFIVCSNEKSGRVSSDRIMASLRNSVRLSGEYDKIPAAIVQQQDTVLNWVVMSLAKHPVRGELSDWLNMDLDAVPVSERAKEADIVYHICNADIGDIALSAGGEQGIKTKGDPQKALKLRKKYSFEYVSERTKQPAKLSVTEIVSQEKAKDLKDKDPEFFPNLPRLSEELDKLTAAEKGTFTHKFMELADYDLAEKSVKDELERLKNKGYFTKKEAEGVYVNRLEEFVRSDFFKRMRRSCDLRREQKFLASVKDLDLTDELSEYTGEEGFIQGIADCIFKEDDGWVLVDYKTDNFTSVDEMKKYSTQLKLYKAAFELLYGERVKSSYIYSFKLGQGLEIKL